MSLPENDLFRMVSLRGAGNGTTIDPSEDAEDSEVIRLLRTKPIDPRKPDPEVVRMLSRFPVLDEDALRGLAVSRLAEAVGNLAKLTAAGLMKVRRSGTDTPDERRTQEELARLLDSWLVGRLTRASFPRSRHEDLIRLSRLWLVAIRRPEVVRDTVVAALAQAQLVLPRWLGRPVARPDGARSGPQALAETVRRERARYANLARDVALAESIQRKAHASYWDWAPEASAAAPSAPRGRTGARPIGVRARRALDDGFYARMDSALEPAERTRLGELMGARGGGARRPTEMRDLGDLLDITELLDEANASCSRIRIFEVEGRTQLPSARPLPAGSERPSVRAMGWGDLIVARDRLVGYKAEEIAHVENVQAGETKTREHERILTTEEVTETERTSRTESEHDLQTTDRHELQSGVESTIQENFSVEAGVDTSGRYGLTKVETSLDVGFERSSTEARSSTTQLAKEIVSKTVEKVIEAVRELRRRSVTQRIREFNSHILANNAAGGAAPTPRSGVYLWVEKIQEVALRHYGTRLMVEFHVPEPGVSLFSTAARPKTKRPKPAPFSIGPTEVVPTNYLCLARAYGARDIEPPPTMYVDVGYTWRSSPDEDADGDESEDTISDLIALPDGYYPVSGRVSVTTLPAGTETAVYLYVAVGGTEIVNRHAYEEDDEWEFTSYSWPNGVPVSLLLHGHFDKTAVLHIALRCQRTPESYTRWQIQTWQRLREAHDVLVQEYERAVLEAEGDAANLFRVMGRSAAVNRALERDELKKWSIKAMRVRSFEDELVDAVVQVGDHPETDPVAADVQAPIVRFFEEAFEWREMSYFLYPYFWGRRGAWEARLAIDGTDEAHDQFLRAGAARVVVSVTPGYEERVLHYLDSDPALPEVERLAKPVPGEVPPGAQADQLWLDLMIERNSQLALGSGTLAVTNGSTTVKINDDSRWEAEPRDLGRELYIDGTRYLVASIVGPREITLDRPYEGSSGPSEPYSTGSVPFGAPWLVRVPTSLVILRENIGLLSS